jgi:hypothetical protein
LVKGEFNVRSLEAIGMVGTDFDAGVVRVSRAFLRKNAKPNALIRISTVDQDGRKKSSIVRIVRAAALHPNEIALQYDDRVELGIKKVGTIHMLQIEPVNQWLGLPVFLLGHPSPIVRMNTIFAIALMIVGALVGFIAGLLI